MASVKSTSSALVGAPWSWARRCADRICVIRCEKVIWLVWNLQVASLLAHRGLGLADVQIQSV